MVKEGKEKQQQKPSFDNNIVLFVDGNYLAFKSYFPLEKKALAMKRFLKATYRLKQKSNAGIVTVSFDHDQRDNFRYQYPWYKKSRKNKKHKTDVHYLAMLKELPNKLKERGVKVNASSKHEADDLIGISAKYFSSKQKRVVIYTGDKDLLQLVDDYIEVWRPIKGTTKKIEIHNMKNFKELNEGFEPYQLRELKGLIGDRSDNIPGVIALDDEVCKDLIRTYGTLDNVYNNLDKIHTPTANILKKKEEIARISLKVGTITTNEEEK